MSFTFASDIYAAGSSPTSVVAVDLNGDTVLDLLVIDPASNGLRVLLGDGSGGFTLQDNFAIAPSSFSIATGDVNGDGLVDVAIAHNGSPNGSLSILLGDGSGGFSASESWSLGFNPGAIALGDFNQDGRADVVLVNESSGGALLLRDATGGFSTETTFATGSSPSDIAIADFDSNGTRDLAVVNLNSASVSVLLGDSSGGLSSQTTFGVGSTPIAAAVGDFDGDSIPDLVVANANGNSLSLLLGVGDGTFETQSVFAVNAPNGIAVGDFSGNGNLDVAVISDIGEQVSVLLGDGAGNLALPLNTSVSSGLNAIAVGDFNGDGLADIATSISGYANNVTVLINKPDLPLPVITGFSNDTGVSNTDGITNDTTPTIVGTAALSTGVTVYFNGNIVGTAPVDGDGNWSFSVASGDALSDGVYSVTVISNGGGGAVSEASAPLVITIDATAAAPVITTLVEDTGVVGDRITSDSTPMLSGTAEAGSTVDVFLGGTLVSSTAANSSGNWSFGQSTALSDGSYSFTAQITDLAGNTSALSEAFVVTVDTALPVAPVLATVDVDTGASDSDRITSDTTPNLSGTAEAGSTVTVFLDGAGAGAAIANTSGNWSFGQTNALSDGSYSLTARATDVAGNTGELSSSFVVTIDTTPPAAPSITSFTEDTGIPGDFITSDTTPTIGGTAEAGSTVTIFLDGVEAGTAIANSSGNWSFSQSTALVDGVYSFTTQATDIAGNTGSISTALSFTIDTQVAATPIIETLIEDTGISDSDGITNDTTPTLQGTAGAGDTITVFLNSTSAGTTTANSAGAWAFTRTTALSDGSYTFTAQAEDAIGKTSALSTAFNVVIDTTPPVAPVLTAVVEDTGVPGDRITNDSTPSISGTAEAGSIVTLFQDGSAVGTTTATTSGNWSFGQTNVLSDGSYSFTARATDIAGNTGVFSSGFVVTIDTTPPAAPTITSFSEDTGTPDDFITSDTTPTIGGMAEAGSTVTVLLNGAAAGTAIADSSGSWSFTQATALSDGTYSFTANATDIAGNIGSNSTALPFTIDTQIAATPTITTLIEDTGFSNSDGITNDTTPTLQGTAGANDTVTVFLNGTAAGTTTADGAGSWAFTRTTALSDGSYTFTSRAVNEVGNTSALSAAFNVVIDTLPPPAPVLDAESFSEDTGVVGDRITSDTTPSISGVAEPNSVVMVRLNGTAAGTAIANSSGNWSFSVSTALSDGNYTFTAQAQDTAGNASNVSSAVAFTIDTTDPAVPAITGFTEDTGASTSDGITSDATPTVQGTAGSGNTITIFLDGSPVGTTTASNGSWSYTQSTALSDGTYSFTAQASDLAGNTSSVSDGLAIAIDTLAPAAPIIASFSDDSGLAGDGITNDSTPTLSGTAEANSTVTIRRNGTVVGNTLAAGDGTWAFTSAVLTDGSYSFTAQATDLAGNVSLASAPLAITIDTTTPMPIITALVEDTGASDSDFITSDSTPTLSGTAEAGSTVTIFLDGSSVGTTTANSSGNWSYAQTTALTDGTYAFTAQATDIADNTSTLSAAIAFTLDTTPPVDPTITAFSEDSGLVGDRLTNDTTPTLSGVAEANSTITVFLNALSVGTAIASASGTWSYTVSSALSDGPYAFTAQATDLAGNTSGFSSAFNLTIDATPPLASSITSLSDDTGVSDSDRITTDTTPTLSGVAEADSTVTVFRNNALVGTTQADSTGNWSFNQLNALASGSYTYTARATDAAGNLSPLSGGLALVVDAIAPTVSITPVQPNPRETGIGTITLQFSEAIANFSKANLTLTRNGTALNLSTAVLSPQTATTFTLSGLLPLTTPFGNYSLSLNPGSVTDIAGNALSSGALQSWVARDLTPPTILNIPTVGPLIQDRLVDAPIPAITIQFSEAVTGVTPAAFTLTRNGTVLDLSGAIASSTNGSTWQLGNLASLTDPNGVYRLTLNAAGSGITDLAGNPLANSAVSNEWDRNRTGKPVGRANHNSGSLGIVIDGTPQADVLRGSNGNDIIRSFAGNDIIRGTGGNDVIFGLDGRDVIYGGGGNDRLNGGLKSDTLYGGPGDDWMNGKGGNDVLVGGAGNDTLIGRLGADTLEGGNGRDTFRYLGLDDAGDTIIDFTPGEDVIDLRAIFREPAFAARTPHTQYKRFVRLVQVGADTQLRVKADGSGPGTSFVTMATLNGLTPADLSPQDFIIQHPILA
ncbi:MAG: VCBS repeat-containing protein [Kaiparowitsia implicata GSE-PSE-MK54-09C]|jgi:hypothetical protein|nr:VCBS repeat-containing protein [Kaiparowitsia implicata GSE-PSE-MK54-09C]